MRKYKVIRRAMDGFQKQKNEFICPQSARGENCFGMLLAIFVVDLIPVLMTHTFPLFFKWILTLSSEKTSFLGDDTARLVCSDAGTLGSCHPLFIQC
jgi:hypothetical protein